MKLLLILMAILAGSSRVHGAPILAFGDFRGHLEPCGCDPRTDVGGIKRLSAALTRYRVVSPTAIVIHSGNLFPQVIKDKTDADGIARSLEIMNPDASLVNETEWGVLSSKQSLPNVPWVLSNGRDTNLSHQVQELISVKSIEIYGYLGIKNKNLQPYSASLLARWKKLSKAKSAGERVLIFSGGDADLANVVAAKFFGTIVTSNRTPLGVEKGDQEQKDEASLMRQFKSKFLAWSVPYGGAGILRLGGLEQTAIPKTLEASIQDRSATSAKPPEGGLNFPKVETIHWLRTGEENGAPESILKVFEAVREASQKQFKLLVERRSKDMATSEFAGVEACSACHKSAYDIWMKSKHASAMITLVNKSRHEDPSCVECHVVGFTAKGGYVSEAVSPKLSNVQCENCHGARKAHVENPLNSPKVDAKAACAECHTPPHSPGFDMASYWKQIEHK